MTQYERDTNTGTDTYARDSFSMRGMARWQVIGISIACAVIVVALLAYII